jgi:hypothetical protein
MGDLFSAIADAEIPGATNPLFQHVLDTCASEMNKVIGCVAVL